MPNAFVYQLIISVDYSCPNKHSSPAICAKGTFANVGSIECKNCSNGFMCPSDGLDVQIPCTNGSYANETRSSECKKCPAGFACLTPDQTPVECNTGQYSLEGSSQCLQCPAGHR